MEGEPAPRKLCGGGKGRGCPTLAEGGSNLQETLSPGSQPGGQRKLSEEPQRGRGTVGGPSPRGDRLGVPSTGGVAAAPPPPAGPRSLTFEEALQRLGLVHHLHVRPARRALRRGPLQPGPGARHLWRGPRHSPGSAPATVAPGPPARSPLARRWPGPRPPPEPRPPRPAPPAGPARAAAPPGGAGRGATSRAGGGGHRGVGAGVRGHARPRGPRPPVGQGRVSRLLNQLLGPNLRRHPPFPPSAPRPQQE